MGWLLLLLLLLPSLASAANWEPETRPAVTAYNEGVALLDAQNPKAAEAKFRRCLKKEPGVGLCLTYDAVAWSRLGRAEKAVPMLRQAVADFPDQADPAEHLAATLFALEQFEEARTFALLATGIAASDPRPLEVLVMIHIRTGEYDEGLAAIERARGHVPDPDLACLQVRVHLEQEAIDAARELLEACRKSEEPHMITNAESSYSARTGERTRGAAAMDSVLAEKRTAFNQLVEAYNLGEWAEADRAATRAIAAKEQPSQSLILRAMARHELGKDLLALADFEKALEAGTWIDVHRSGALTGIITKTAELQLQDLLQLGSSMQVQLLIGVARFDDAETALRQAREAFGDTPALLASEARLRMGQGRVPEALAVVRGGLEEHRGAFDMQSVAADLASDHFEQLQPEDIAVLLSHATMSTVFNLGAAYYNAQRFDEVLRIFEPLTGTVATSAERAPPGEDPWAEAWRADLELEQARINRLAHDSACRLTDADAAAALWPLLDPPELSSGMSHAILMLNQKRYAEAVVALDAGGAAEATDNRPQIVQLYLLSTARSGDLDAALVWAADPVAPQGGRLELATMLGKNKRYADALGLLKGRCGELSGEARDVCEQNIRYYEHQLK